MPQLRSPIDALKYALARRQMAQETGRSIGAPIGAGISRGLGMAEDRRRDKAAEAYRAAQMKQRQEEFGAEEAYRTSEVKRHKLERADDISRESARYQQEAALGEKKRGEDIEYRNRVHADQMLTEQQQEKRLTEQGRAKTAMDFYKGVGGAVGKVGDWIGGAMKEGARSAEKGRSEERADIRTDLAIGAHNRTVVGDAARSAREAWKMTAARFKERVKDFDPTDVAWLRKNRAAAKRDPTLIDKWGNDQITEGRSIVKANLGTMTPDEMREFYQLLDEAEDAYAAAKGGLAPAPAGPGPGPDEEEDDEDLEAILGED